MPRLLRWIAPALLLAGCGDEPVRITEPAPTPTEPAVELRLEGRRVEVLPRMGRGLALTVRPDDGPAYHRELRVAFGRDPGSGAWVERRTLAGPDGWVRVVRSRAAHRGENPMVFRVETAGESREVRIDRVGNLGRFTYTWRQGDTRRVRTQEVDFRRLGEGPYAPRLVREVEEAFADLAAGSALGNHPDLALLDAVLSHPDLPAGIEEWSRTSGVTPAAGAVELTEAMMEFCHVVQNLQTVLCKAKYTNSFLNFFCESGILNDLCGALASLHVMLVTLNDTDLPDTDFEPPPDDTTGP